MRFSKQTAPATAAWRWKALLILVAALSALLLGVAAAVSPALAPGLALAPALVIAALVWTDALALLAIGIAPLGYGLVLHAGMVAFRFSEVLWCLVFMAAIAKAVTLWRQWPRLPELVKPLGLLLAASVLSTVVSEAPAVSARETVQLAYLSLLFCAVSVSFSTPAKLRKAVDVLAIATLLMGAVGLVKASTGLSLIPTVDVYPDQGLRVETRFTGLRYSSVGQGPAVLRLDAFYQNSVETAAHLSAVILLLASLLFSGQVNNPRRRALYLAALLGAIPVWLLSGSRMAYVALGLLITILALLRRRPGILVPTFVAFLALFVVSPGLFARFQGGLAAVPGSTNIGHYAGWLAALRMFSTKPVLGHGPGAFQQQTGYLILGGVQTWGTLSEGAHNMLLQAAAEMGLIGFGALLWFVGAMLATLWKAVRQARGGPWSGIMEGMFLAVCALVLMNLTTNYFQKDANWTVWALGYASALMVMRGSAPAIRDKHPAESLSRGALGRLPGGR